MAIKVPGKRLDKMVINGHLVVEYETTVPTLHEKIVYVDGVLTDNTFEKACMELRMTSKRQEEEV